MRDVRNSDRYDVPVPSFTQAVRVAAGTPLLFVSGITSRGPDGQIVAPGDIAAQTRQVMTQMSSIVENAGGSMSDVVKITTFVRKADDIRTISEIRREYFGVPGPASSTVEVSRLFDPEQLIEIEAVVQLPADDDRDDNARKDH